MSYSAIIVRIQFPPTCSVASKSLSLDTSLTGAQAIKFIQEHVGSAVADIKNPGLYIEQQGLWLDDTKRIQEYAATIKQAETVEYRERPGKAPQAASATDSSSNNTTALIILAVAVAVGVGIYLSRRR